MLRESLKLQTSFPGSDRVDKLLKFSHLGHFLLKKSGAKLGGIIVLPTLANRFLAQQIESGQSGSHLQSDLAAE